MIDEVNGVQVFLCFNSKMLTYYLLIVRALSLREARGERPTVFCVMGEARTARAWALQTQYKNHVQINFLNVLREFWLHIRILRKILRQNMSGQFYSTIIFAGAATMEEVHEEKMAHFWRLLIISLIIWQQTCNKQY